MRHTTVDTNTKESQLPRPSTIHSKCTHGGRDIHTLLSLSPSPPPPRCRVAVVIAAAVYSVQQGACSFFRGHRATRGAFDAQADQGVTLHGPRLVFCAVRTLDAQFSPRSIVCAISRLLQQLWIRAFRRLRTSRFRPALGGHHRGRRPWRQRRMLWLLHYLLTRRYCHSA